MRDIQKNVMEFVDPDMVFFIDYEDEPVAFCVIFPDMNPLLKRLNGRIGLTGLLKYLLYRREINGLRLLMFGIKEKFRQLGLPMLAFQHVYKLAREKEKYRYLELGWTLEDNESINSLARKWAQEDTKNIAYSENRYRFKRGTYRLEGRGRIKWLSIGFPSSVSSGGLRRSPRR